MLKKFFLNFKRAKNSFYNHYKILGLFGTLRYSVLRTIKRKGCIITIRVKGLKRKISLRNKLFDTHIFTQIFIKQELNFAVNKNVNTIIDCGANIGLASLYFKRKFPEAKIICVEPEASNFELLEKNVGGYDNIRTHKGGVWNKSIPLYLIDTGEGHASFQVSESNDNGNSIGEINAISIVDLMDKYGFDKIDLLKMDIEGSEYACFKNNPSPWLSRISCIAIEIHENLNPGCKKLIDLSLTGHSYDTKGEYHIYSKIQ